MQIIWQGFKFRDVFVDISKEFGKAWYKGLIFKLKQNGNLLNLLRDVLRNRKQRV